ncbi:MAG: class I SAM-dependent methyltransferase [Acidobacteria bacterium]|nr:class I SAM-dependent methyltransferase [Acidobacteriota bacterium]
MDLVEYERFADIYGIWTATAGSTHKNKPFYVDAYLAADGPVAELGVGDGRIAVDAAAGGRTITGVDLSPAMLDLCRARAERAGVLDRLTLLQADFRTFTLAEPAALIALPYHSLGHLTTLPDKREALLRIHGQLRPGGRFLFDDFFMTPDRLDRMRQVQLRAEYVSPTGDDTLLWVTSLVDEAAQTMRVITWADTLDAAGTMQARRYRPLSLSWMTPAQTKRLLEETGFAVEACLGDFDGTPFDAAAAEEQIWIARKDVAA